MVRQLQGYIEGYYGALLSWADRSAIVKRMHRLGLGSYCYAPKEDSRHRLLWREPYDQQWLDSFRTFCQLAADLDIRVMAGIAPGLDFRFSADTVDKDFDLLLTKSKELVGAGARDVVLLMDDIDADFSERNPTAGPEGYEHARLANRLSEKLDCPLLVVPRVYADEIHTESPEYLPAFCEELSLQHRVFYCGQRIVEPHINTASLSLLRRYGEHQVVFWDNLYANDYCPRRLYLGRWRDRSLSQAIMLNPTGMPRTDEFLLTLMVSELNDTESDKTDSSAVAKRLSCVYSEHEIPECFLSVANWFSLPSFEFPDSVDLDHLLSVPVEEQLAALDTLLWRWKSPLSREWYPHLMGLKQDLLLLSENLGTDRIHKTQTPAIAHYLLQGRMS